MPVRFRLDHECRNERGFWDYHPHHLPHLHAYYQEAVAVYGLDPVELISGSLPLRQQRLVEAWAEMHRDELLADWRLLQQGRRPTPIAPLQ